MRQEIKDIKSGLGLGIIKFGMSRDQVREILGEPDELELPPYSDEKEDQSETWHYDDFELSLGFDQEDNWRLGTLAITSENYELLGKGLIGLNKEELISELNSLKIDDLELEDWSSIDIPTQELLGSESLGINFWFEDNKLSEIQWGPLFIDENTIRWPE